MVVATSFGSLLEDLGFFRWVLGFSFLRPLWVGRRFTCYERGSVCTEPRTSCSLVISAVVLFSGDFVIFSVNFRYKLYRGCSVLSFVISFLWCIILCDIILLCFLI